MLLGFNIFKKNCFYQCISSSKNTLEFFQDLQEQLELLQNNYKGREQGLLEDFQQKFATADSGISTMEWYHLKVKVLSFSNKRTNTL